MAAMSKANARQGKAHEAGYKAYRSNAQREKNALRRLVRHLKAVNDMRRRRGLPPLTLAMMPGCFRDAWEKNAKAAGSGFVKNLGVA